MESGDKRSYNLKSYIVASLGVIAGLGLIIASEYVDRQLHPIVYGIATSVATTLLVGGILGLAYEFALRGDLIAHFDRAISTLRAEVAETVSRVDRRIELSTSLDSVGLSSVEPKESVFNYSDMILKSKKLHFVFNDGRTWFSHHSDDMHIRLEKPGLTTVVVLICPSSPFIEALALKVDETADELRNKIESTIKILSRIKHEDHKLMIVGHCLPSSYSLVLNEEQAVFIPYPMARKSDRIPCFVFNAAQDGFYGVLRKDIAALLNHPATKHLYPSQLV